MMDSLSFSGVFGSGGEWQAVNRPISRRTLSDVSPLGVALKHSLSRRAVQKTTECQTGDSSSSYSAKNMFESRRYRKPQTAQ